MYNGEELRKIVIRRMKIVVFSESSYIDKEKGLLYLESCVCVLFLYLFMYIGWFLDEVVMYNKF